MIRQVRQQMANYATKYDKELTGTENLLSFAGQIFPVRKNSIID